MKVVMRSHSENDFKRNALISLNFSRCHERVQISECGKTLDNNNFVTVWGTDNEAGTKYSPATIIVLGFREEHVFLTSSLPCYAFSAS